MALIPQRFIDDLLDKVDIVEVVGARISLRKSGKNYSARCPFHDEKTPSFTVNPDKQFYYCFGCGAGGNAIGFVMDYDRADFPGAVEMLARHAGMEVPRENRERDPADGRRKQLYALLDEAEKYYRTQLRKHPDARLATEYLKKRGLSGVIAGQFGIGFAPPGWDNLISQLGDDDQRVQLLLEAGLVIRKEGESNRVYDRFRQRIMFPIRDTRGRTIGFGGRVLGDDKPKYLNSPETPVFHKGSELYGLYEAHTALREIPNLVVVEGYMDVVALAQHGIHNAVATLGTAATVEHLAKLFRYTAEVIFCFDGDSAGRKAARRALETSLAAMTDGRSARFLFLPEGEDPDTLVRKLGAEGFGKLLSAAEPLSEFLFATLEDGVNLATVDGKARLSKLAAPLINRIPEGVYRQLMLKQLAQRTDMDVDSLRNIVVAPVPDVAVPEEAQEAPPERSPEGDEYADYAGLYSGGEHSDAFADYGEDAGPAFRPSVGAG
ncbi:MAG: DNA primase, partial [Porticoccaceae bacterium]